MNEPSAFQGQYPLSPRKFWKKLVSSNLGLIFLLLFIVIPFWVFVFNLGTIFPQTIDANPTIPSAAYKIFTAVLFLLFFYLILDAWYLKVYIRRYYYDCGEQFITIKKGVFAPTEIHVQYQKIQDVYVDQDILDRMMGLYDVHIASATATSGIEAHIDGVNADVAENLKNIILAKIHGAGNSPQVSTPQTPQAQTNPVQFSQKISSDTYPINGKWVVSALVSSFFLSLVYSWIFLGAFLKNNHSLGLVVFGIIFFLFVIYKSVWKSNFYFEFTPDYILLRTGVISRSENHLPYKSIQNILNTQGVIDRMLGLSTVVIQNAAQQMVPNVRGKAMGAGSAIALLWQPKEKAEELNKILNDIVSKMSPQNYNSTGV